MPNHTLAFRIIDDRLPALLAGLLAVMLALPALAGPPDDGKPAAPASAEKTIIMQKHTLRDPGMGNMESHIVLAPKGWQVTGGGWWPPPQLFKILPSQDVTITAPDGRRVRIGPSIGAVDFLPSQQTLQLGIGRPAEGAIDGGMPVLYMPANPEQWRMWLEKKVLPQEYKAARNLRVEKVVVVPELTQILRRQLEPIRQMQAQQNQQAQMMGMPMHSSCDAVAYAASYSYEEGEGRWDEMVVFGVGYLTSDTQMGRQIWWGVEPNVTFRAPAGQLDANLPLLMAVAQSIQPTPQWARMKADHMAKMQQIEAKGAADRSRIIAESNREISRIITEGYESRQASLDRSHERFINSIRGVENYTEPGSQTQVQLPNNYEHVYTNRAGEYILTNDSLYNPNTDPMFNNHTWTPMEVAK